MGKRITAHKLLENKAGFLSWLKSLNKRCWFQQGSFNCPLSRFLTAKTGYEFHIEQHWPPSVMVAAETHSLSWRAAEKARLPLWARDFDAAFHSSSGRMTVDRVIEVAERV